MTKTIGQVSGQPDWLLIPVVRQSGEKRTAIARPSRRNDGASEYGGSPVDFAAAFAHGRTGDRVHAEEQQMSHIINGSLR